MTTTLTIDGSTVPAHGAGGSAAPARPVVRRDSAYRLSFAGIMRSERIKLLSLRSIKLTLLATALVGLGLSALIAMLWSSDFGTPEAIFGSSPAELQMYLLTVSTFTAPFLALIFGVLGVFAVTSEYSSGMILSTLTAVPKRTPVLVAKAIVTARIAALTAVVIVVGGLLLALAFLPEAAAQLGTTAVLSGVLGTIAYLVLISLLAFGIAALLRSTAGGIAVIAGLTFVLPIAMQVLMMSGWEWVPTVSAYLPAELGSTLAGGITDAGGVAAVTFEGEAAATRPDYWMALVSMTLWAAAAIVPAGIAFKRRDAR